MSCRQVCVTVLLIVCSRAGLAQQPALPPVDSAVVALQLIDGSSVTGRVVATTDSSCTIVTKAGVTVVVPRRSLAGWSALAGAGLGRFGRRDPGRTRLFLAPTARLLRQGEGYVGDYYVLFASAGYGILDRFTLAGGMSVIPGLRIDQQFLYLAPKVGLVRTPNFNLAVGALYMRLEWSDVVDAWGGVAYAATTVGSEDAAVSVGLGWPFASGGTGEHPWVMGGGELRVSRGIKLLAEGWKFPGSNEVPVVGGVRFVEEKVAVDVGLVQIVGSDYHGVLPWLDFSVRW